MFTSLGSFEVESLGETVLIVRAPGFAALLARYLEEVNLVGVEDVVPAFDQVALYYKGTPDQIALLGALEGFGASPTPSGRVHSIPVCYELGVDLQQVCDMLALDQPDFVRSHAGIEYDCKAVGFCPGFAYLGWLDESLGKLGRKETPRLRVEPGSVAIAGRLTAVYPLERPGGWWLVGKTPLTLVDVKSEYFPLAVGDTVRFRPITREEFDSLSGGRL